MARQPRTRRTTTRRGTSAATGALGATAGPPVRVRMYRQGLGDCILITFGAGAAKSHMLIDCGTLGTRTTPDNSLRRVVGDVLAETGGQLAVVVATHEHKDHVSGFRRSLWPDTTRASHVWMAWTENPECTLAQDLEEFQNDLRAALVASLGAAPAGSGAALAARDLMGFAGDGALGADDFAETVDEAMKFVRDKFGAEPTYLKPRKPPIEIPEIPGFRFYVLGPPHDKTKLEDMGAHGSAHLYGLRAAAVSAGVGTGARSGLSMAEADEADLQMPFDCRHRFADKDRLSGQEWYEEYYKKENDWRRIDGEWVSAAADLALQLDSLTNNTSLALAIERIADRRVLLFPADAQQGNWLSWKDNDQWTVPDGAGGTGRVTMQQLLERTVFYKVGHHGSHNATIGDEGLERMTRGEELTAFIPVDRAVALDRHPKNSWRMPARALYRRLLERCNGRVVRTDTGWAADAAGGGPTEAELVGLATPLEWQEWKAAQDDAAGRVTIGPLFIEFKLD